MLAEDEREVGVKTRHATLEQLVEIEDEAIGQYNDLVPAFQRAYHHHEGRQSRHLRNVIRRCMQHEMRWLAAQRYSNRIIHPQDPEFLF